MFKSNFFKNKKGQTSTEFVILVGFMILGFLTFYIVIQAKLVQANRESADVYAKQAEFLVLNELALAESVTDGYYREFELPYMINGMYYNISLLSGPSLTPEIVISYLGKERVYFIPQTYVNRSSTLGKGMNNITKNNGVILIQHMG